MHHVRIYHNGFLHSVPIIQYSTLSELQQLIALTFSIDNNIPIQSIIAIQTADNDTNPTVAANGYGYNSSSIGNIIDIYPLELLLLDSEYFNSSNKIYTIIIENNTAARAAAKATATANNINSNTNNGPQYTPFY